MRGSTLGKERPVTNWIVSMMGALFLWGVFNLLSFEHSVPFLLCLIYARLIVLDILGPSKKGNVEK